MRRIRSDVGAVYDDESLLRRAVGDADPAGRARRSPIFMAYTIMAYTVMAYTVMTDPAGRARRSLC